MVVFFKWYIYPLIIFCAWILLTSSTFSQLDSINYYRQLINLDGYLFTGYYSVHNVNQIVSNDLINKHILIFTAHPDDESMFFAPTITELTKENYNNHFHIVCLSNGGMNGLGHIREKELQRAAKLFGVTSAKTLDYEDNINSMWDTTSVANTISNEVETLKNNYNIDDHLIVLITFDKEGISQHPNHKSLYNGLVEFKKSSAITTYALVSWNMLHKYSGLLITDVQLVMINIAKKLNWDKPSEGNVIIFSDLNTIFLNLSAMSWAHYSQIVWFRWIWILISRYMNANELVKL
ncbi:hypothetical protein CANINC_001383 [Pichia inconspicua]|uniref:N-acetylglucosaminylphosphatidylinositol deacetylase n=1 Tax=Pichia inconspicua TaxID=52247 RepID=A0A4T0X5E2_9ASCO|nr:hypothetical protein CANINC_001383 [[Candida] inconspicua]